MSHMMYDSVQQCKEGLELLVLCKEFHSLQLINFGNIRLERTYLLLVLLKLLILFSKTFDPL